MPRSNNALTQMAALILLLAVSCERANAAPLPQWTREARVKWWTENATSDQWIAKAQSTHQALLNMQAQRGTAWAMSDPAFVQWMGHVYWLDLFPDDWRTGHAAYVQAYRSLALEPTLPWLLLSHVRPTDDRAAALRILCDIYRQAPKTCREYAPLAVAMALVWDQPLETAWPHPFVDRKTVPIGTESPVDRFQFFVEAHRAGKLLHDPRSLSVHELVFLVDSPLAFSELAFCQRIQVRQPRHLAKLYQAVDYNYRRVTRNDTIWNTEPYTVAKIAKHGGICMDQAYLVCQTGKAQGVPTILFFGQGVDGVHAWVGFLEEKGRWHFDVARYEGQRYPVGQAYHPQTRQRISDVELAAFNHQLERNPAFRQARLMLGWARMNPETRFYPELVLRARNLLPQLMDTWYLEDAWHENKGKNPARHAQFLEKWIDHFRKAPAARFEGQKRLYLLYREHGMQKDAERIHKQILKESASKRFDLGIHLAAESIFADAADGRWDQAHEAFEKAMKQFRKQTGGHLFYGLLRPYVQTCLEERQVNRAKDAMKTARQFDLRKGTVMANDLAALQKRVSSY